MITSSLPLGVGFHAAGAMCSANCYAPQKLIKKWSWETFWMTQAFWCWLLLPVVGALITIPHLRLVLHDAPTSRMLLAFLMGVAYGIGGTAFNISIKAYNTERKVFDTFDLAERAGINTFFTTTRQMPLYNKYRDSNRSV